MSAKEVQRITLDVVFLADRIGRGAMYVGGGGPLITSVARAQALWEWRTLWRWGWRHCLASHEGKGHDQGSLKYTSPLYSCSASTTAILVNRVSPSPAMYSTGDAPVKGSHRGQEENA